MTSLLEGSALLLCGLGFLGKVPLEDNVYELGSNVDLEGA